MRYSLRFSVRFFLLISLALPATNASAIDVMFALKNHPDKFEETEDPATEISEGDAAQIAIFEERGYDLIFWDNNMIQSDPNEALWIADEADLVYVSESISSGRMSALADTESPLISNENYGCDSLGITWQEGDLGRVDGHGSPGTLNPDGNDLLAGTSFGTGIRIVDETHPIAIGAGLTNGDHIIYDNPGGRRSWCTPGEEAQIIATLPEFNDDYPNAAALLVYEQGTLMADDREAFGMRIGAFLSDTNRGPELADPSLEADGTGPGWEATLLTDAGRRLLEASIDYALGIEPDPPVAGNPLDLNSDDVVNGADVDLACGQDLAPFFAELNSLVGDIDFDGKVAFSDFLVLSDNFGNAGSYSAGDLNCGGSVDFADFLILSDAFGNSVGAEATSVPEPNALSMFGLGLLFVGLLRRKRATA